MVAVGALVAATGWIGVAWRVPPWAPEDQRLWRAATSLTYANAAAGLLAALVLVGLGRLVGRRASALERAALCLLVVGLGATLSRGGMAAAGLRPVARAAGAPFVGAAIALATLLPSMPAGSPSRPVVAALGLTAGLFVACVLPALSVPLGRRRLGAAAAAAAAVLVLAAGGSHALGAVGRPV